MQKPIYCAGLGALALAAILAAGPSAYAETVNLRGSLKGSGEVPANDSKATGTVQATYDTSSKRLSYTIEYSGLTGNPTAAHFHGATPPSPPAPNSAVAVPITVSASPIKGAATLNDTQAEELLAGRWYVNIHTAAHPAGEIRGSVAKGM
jgi:hypothetical protein